MDIFISSTRRGLEAERDNTAALLSALGHKPIRFEDFGATPTSSRSACLDAVVASDVYVLLLGPSYGDAMPDTGMSPTEEEFNAALSSGKPILVFLKADMEPEPAQATFIKRVGNYANGRFWFEFSDSGELSPAVVAALGNVPSGPPEVVWYAIPPVEYSPIHSSRGPRVEGQPTYASILELHVLPIEAPVRPTQAQASNIADSLIAHMRAVRFIDAGSPAHRLDRDSGVHVQRPSEPGRRTFGQHQPSVDPYCGARIGPLGEVAVYRALPTDVLGCVTNSEGLTSHLQAMMDVASPFKAAGGDRFAVVACLIDEGRTIYGDPLTLGSRTAAQLAAGGHDLVGIADGAVTRDALTRAPREVAHEVAARLAHGLRQRA